MNRLERVGVLGLQGDFERHTRSIEALGLEAVRVSLPEHLEGLGALLMPGGESSTMLNLLESTGLRAPIERFVRERAVLATCAGLILLARAADRLVRPTLGALDVEVARNAYGRQLHSFSERVEMPALAGTFPGVFIRAPRIVSVGAGVHVVATRAGSPGTPPEVVGVRSGRVVGLCFHPELTSDLRVHRWFLSEVAALTVPAPVAASGAGARSPEAA
ncbi:MAG: pyridoxal 5'-phosphate synthase glutaminase subunit PdxT [Candidatus Eiseniibacteriota bacterium]